MNGPEDELTPELARKFETYHWPGNLRELHNAVAHRIALGEMANLESLQRAAGHASAPGSAAAKGGASDSIQKLLEQELPYVRGRDQILAEFDRRYCEWMLDRHGGNVTKASAASGIARRYFYVIRNRGSKA